MIPVHEYLKTLLPKGNGQVQMQEKRENTKEKHRKNILYLQITERKAPSVVYAKVRNETHTWDAGQTR